MSENLRSQSVIGSAVRQLLLQIGRMLEEEDVEALLAENGPLRAAVNSWRQTVQTHTSGVSAKRARELEDAKLAAQAKLATVEKERNDLLERNKELLQQIVALNKKEASFKQQILDSQFQSNTARAEAKKLDLEIRDLRRKVRELEGGPPMTAQEAAPLSKQEQDEEVAVREPVIVEEAPRLLSEAEKAKERLNSLFNFKTTPEQKPAEATPPPLPIAAVIAATALTGPDKADEQRVTAEFQAVSETASSLKRTRTRRLTSVYEAVKPESQPEAAPEIARPRDFRGRDDRGRDDHGRPRRRNGRGRHGGRRHGYDHPRSLMGEREITTPMAALPSANPHAGKDTLAAGAEPPPSSSNVHAKHSEPAAVDTKSQLSMFEERQTREVAAIDENNPKAKAGSKKTKSEVKKSAKKTAETASKSAKKSATKPTDKTEKTAAKKTAAKKTAAKPAGKKATTTAKEKKAAKPAAKKSEKKS